MSGQGDNLLGAGCARRLDRRRDARVQPYLARPRKRFLKRLADEIVAESESIWPPFLLDQEPGDHRRLASVENRLGVQARDLGKERHIGWAVDRARDGEKGDGLLRKALESAAEDVPNLAGQGRGYSFRVQSALAAEQPHHLIDEQRIPTGALTYSGCHGGVRLVAGNVVYELGYLAVNERAKRHRRHDLASSAANSFDDVGAAALVGSRGQGEQDAGFDQLVDSQGKQRQGVRV